MIYVDQPIHRWRGKLWCHLVADDLEELHSFAAKTGLKREWFQNHRIQPHYDITASKRVIALKMGAKELTTKEMAERIAKLIKTRIDL